MDGGEYIIARHYSLSEKRARAQKKQNMDERPNKNICIFSVHPAGRKNGRAADTQLHIKFPRP